MGYGHLQWWSSRLSSMEACMSLLGIPWICILPADPFCPWRLTRQLFGLMLAGIQASARKHLVGLKAYQYHCPILRMQLQYHMPEIYLNTTLAFLMPKSFYVNPCVELTQAKIILDGLESSWYDKLERVALQRKKVGFRLEMLPRCAELWEVASRAQCAGTPFFKHAKF